MMRSGILLNFFLILALNLFGQDEPLVQDTVGIENVLIEATRSAQNDPVTFSNISKTTIRKLNVGQDPSNLLQSAAPSIVAYSDAGTGIGNYVQFRMRGISQNRINVTLNGVPLNDMIDQGVFFSNFSDFTSNVESMQVQRGVSASNVGVASYGGAVNFESINLFTDDARTNLQLTTGSFGTLRTSASVATGLMENGIGAYGRFTRTTTDGYKYNSGSDAYTIFGSVGYLGKKDVLKVTGFMGKTQNGQSYLPVLLSDIEFDPRTNYNHPNDTDDFEQESVQVQYSRTMNSNLALDATLYYGGARGVFPFGIDDQTQFVFGLENDHYGFLSRLRYDVDKWTVSGGIQGYLFDRTNFEYEAPNVTNPYFVDHSKKKEISLFGKTKYSLERLTFYADFQLRSVGLDLKKDLMLGTGIDQSESWLFANVVGGVNYQVTPEQSLYISYGTTGREPTRSDILNGAVESERVRDLELGWRIRNRQLELGVNLFHMDFENEISQVGALQERSYMEIRQNVDESRRSGFELTLNALRERKVSLGLSAAYLFTNVSDFDAGGEVFNDVEHIFAPKWTVLPAVNWKISNRFNWQLSGRYVSESFMELSNDPAFTLTSFFVLNTQFDLMGADFWNVKVLFNNIFDKQYFTDGAPVDLDFDGIVEGPGFRIQAPRHIYLMVTFEF